jgi:hypothetical protein
MFVVDDFTAWVVGLFADAGRRRLTSFVLGSDQERALRAATRTAVQLTAEDLCPEGGERTAQLAMVINEVFADRRPQLSTAAYPTLLQALQAGISEELAPLDDPDITGTGTSSAELLEVPAATLAEKLTAHLVQEILSRGSHGGPLAPVADQLNHDVTHLQGQRIEGMMSRLVAVVLEALVRMEAAPLAAAPPSSVSDVAKRDLSGPEQLSKPRPVFRPIETVLRRAYPLNPEFGRPSGSAWIDLESGYHPFTQAQVALVSDSLGRHRFHLVFGSSGAWREQFARYIGWHLTNQQFKVFYVNCSTLPTNAWATDFPSLDSPSTWLIVDNAHANPALCEDLLAILEDSTSSLRCIFASDRAIDNALIYRPYFKSDLMALPSTTLNSRDEAVNLIKRYAEKKLGRRVGSSVTRNFMEASKSRKHSALFYADEEGAEYNLWLLLAHLRSWDGRRFLSASKLSSLSRHFVDEAITGPLLNVGVSAASMSTVVAYFHNLGIGTPVTFLTDKLKFTNEEIFATERQGIVARTSRMIWLTDDHLPYPLKEAGISRHEIRDDIARRLGLGSTDGNLFFSLESAFIMGGFPGYDLVLLNGGSFAALNFESFVLPLHPAEIDLTSLERLLQAERSPLSLGRALAALSRRDPEFAASLSHRLNLPALNEAVSTAESVRAIAWLIEGLNRIAPTAAQRLALSCDKQALAHRLRSEFNLGTAANLLWALRNADAEVAEQVAALLADEEWVSRALKEKHGARLGWFLFVLNDISGLRAQDIVSRIGIQPLAEVVKSHPTCRDVAALFWGVNASPRIASALARMVPRRVLRDCIAYETNLVFSGMLLRSLAAADRQVASAVTRLLDLPSLAERVRDEADENAAALFLLGLSEAAPKRGRPVVSDIQARLKAEERSAAMHERMFASMDPTAQALAGRSRRRAARRLSAIDGFRVAADSVSREGNRFKQDPSSMWTLWTYDPVSCTSVIRRNWNEMAALFANSASVFVRAILAIIMFDSDPRKFEFLLESIPREPLTAANIGEIEPALALGKGLHAQPAAMLLSRYTCTEAEAINLASSVDYRTLEEAILAIQPVAPELALALIRRVDCTRLLLNDYRSTRDRAIKLMLKVRPECIQTLMRLTADEGDHRESAKPGCQGLKKFEDAAKKIWDSGDLIGALWNEIGCADELDQCSDLGAVAQAIRRLSPGMAHRAVGAMSLERLESRLQEAAPDRWAAGCIHVISRTRNTLLFLKLIPVISARIKDHPSFGIDVLDGLPRGEPEGEALIAELGPETLRRMVIGNSSVWAVAGGLELLANLMPSAAKAVAEDLARDFLQVILGRPNDLGGVTNLLKVLRRIDPDIARYAASCISPRDLASEIRNADSLSILSVEEGIGVIASLNADLAEAVAEDVVTAYVHSEARGTLQFDYAARILSPVAEVDLSLLRSFVAKIDMTIMAHALQKIIGPSGQVYGLELFLRLIMSVDVTKVAQLHRLVPKAITTETLDDAAQDSLGVKWERAMTATD